jgi:hypothetical protein
MNNNPLEPLEQQLARSRQSIVPEALRTPVLAAVHRELAAQRWERRLARAASGLLVVGIALNWTVGLRGERAASRRMEVAAKPEVIFEIAVVVAEATDVETGNIFAQHWAALSGSTLSNEQAAAIEQTIKRNLRNAGAVRKAG